MPSLTQQAKQLRDPQIPTDAPEAPADLRTVDQVDWQALVVAALGPQTTLDKPLPQLLLRLGSVISDLTGNAEHAKHFLAGTSSDQVDLADSVTAALTRNKKRVGELAMEVEQLKRDVELLKAAGAAPEDLSAVQPVPATVQR